MQKNQLGKSDMQVSEICLGTMNFGEQNTQQEAFDQLDLAQDRGVNFLDTAELYPSPPREETQGRTEEIIGAWLQNRKNRGRWIIASKVVGRSDRMGWFRKDKRLPRLDQSNIDEAIASSLRRMGCEYIDLYQLHWPDRKMQLFGGLDYTHFKEQEQIFPEETMAAFDKHLTRGTIRAIGLSNETPWGVMRFLQTELGKSKIVTVQNAYNLLNRTDELGLSEIYLRENLSSIPYSPLAQGVLSGKYIDGACPPNSRKALYNRIGRYETPPANGCVKQYRALAHEYGLNLTTLALGFCKSRPFIAATIIGATNLAQLQENIDAFSVALPPRLCTAIDTIHKNTPNPCP